MEKSYGNQREKQVGYVPKSAADPGACGCLGGELTIICHFFSKKPHEVEKNSRGTRLPPRSTTEMVT